MVLKPLHEVPPALHMLYVSLYGDMGSLGLMVESRTHNRKVASSSLGPAGIVGGGSECTALSPPTIPASVG